MAPEKLQSKLKTFEHNQRQILDELVKTQAEMKGLESQISKVQKTLEKASKKATRLGVDADEVASKARTQAADDLVDEAATKRKLPGWFDESPPTPPKGGAGGGGGGAAGGAGGGKALAKTALKTTVKTVAVIDIATAKDHDETVIPIILYFAGPKIWLLTGVVVVTHAGFTGKLASDDICRDPKYGTGGSDEQPICKIEVHPDAPKDWKKRLIPGVTTGYEVNSIGSIRYH